MTSVNGWTIVTADGQLIASKSGFRSVTAPVPDLLKLIAILPQFEARERQDMVDRMNRAFA